VCERETETETDRARQTEGGRGGKDEGGGGGTQRDRRVRADRYLALTVKGFRV
jgi:hypothetical protein